MCPYQYYTMIRHTSSPEYFRLQLVQSAEAEGIKPTARLFHTSVKTVRKWLRRYNGSLASLHDKSKAPHNSPRRLTPELEKQIVKLKRDLPTWGAERLKRDFQLPCSAKMIARVYREHGLLRSKRRKKHRTKQDLRAVKQQWALFQQLDVDTKDLFDIPEYWTAMTKYRLPRCQYTAREVVSGLTFLAYAQERSLTYAVLFIDRILTHLKACGVELGAMTVQTDNGSEFVGSWHQKKPSAFTQLIEQHYGATHYPDFRFYAAKSLVKRAFLTSVGLQTP